MVVVYSKKSLVHTQNGWIGEKLKYLLWSIGSLLDAVIMKKQTLLNFILLFFGLQKVYVRGIFSSSRLKYVTRLNNIYDSSHMLY